VNCVFIARYRNISGTPSHHPIPRSSNVRSSHSSKAHSSRLTTVSRSGSVGWIQYVLVLGTEDDVFAGAHAALVLHVDLQAVHSEKGVMIGRTEVASGTYIHHPLHLPSFLTVAHCRSPQQQKLPCRCTDSNPHRPQHRTYVYYSKRVCSLRFASGCGHHDKVHDKAHDKFHDRAF
jgi:hypothetical protein